MNVHRNCYTVATHISEQELGTLCLAQMVPKGLLLVCKLPGHPLFFDAAANVLVVVVGLNQVQIVANRLYAIEVVGIGSVDDLAITEMYLVAAVRHVVGQLKRNHIAEAIPIHNAWPKHINLLGRHPRGHQRRDQPAATAEAECWPLGRQPPQGPLAEMVSVNMGKQHQLELRNIWGDLLVWHAAIHQYKVVEDHGVALTAG